MIPLEQAQAEVIDACPSLAAVEVDVADALGLTLAEDVVASEPVPPFRNTAMDGFAVVAADLMAASTDAPVRLKVIATVAAGRPAERRVERGEAIRIMTGAPFPPGADAIAIVENTRTVGEAVEVLAPAVPGEHIRDSGSDIAAGTKVFSAGASLGPGHLGVLCSIGCQRVTVVPAPVVGVLSTGDELVEGGDLLQPGQIRDSNRRTLLSLLRRDGFVARDLGIAPDRESAIEAAIRRGLDTCDAILTSGGVSMGDFDYVKVVLDRMGQMHWMQVAIRPAKPFAFGVVGGTPVFGLPGNPVSSMVSYELLARPGLRRMAGVPDDELHRKVTSATVVGPGWRAARDGRTSFVRARAAFGADGRLQVSSTGGQASHQLYAMALADSLAISPPGVDASEGDEVQVMPLWS